MTNGDSQFVALSSKVKRESSIQVGKPKKHCKVERIYCLTYILRDVFWIFVDVRTSNIHQDFPPSMK